MISQNFPPRVLEACRMYKYDEELRCDPIEYRTIYEELKVEAALITIVSTQSVFAVNAKPDVILVELSLPRSPCCRRQPRRP